MVKKQLTIPLIAAGGIATGRGMLAAMVLGADGVQVGSRFAASVESSAHENFKNTIVNCKEGETQVTLKELAPVRLIKNKFYNDLQELYKTNPTVEELKSLLGRARAKKGMFEGDLAEGELEIGQVSARLKGVISAREVIEQTIDEFYVAQKSVGNISF
jgi:enoyl-[acyl-carrier protein] reductase II